MSFLDMQRSQLSRMYRYNRYYSTETYVQGPSPEPSIREYFYYIDHRGQLFLDDARFKNFTSCFKGTVTRRYTLFKSTVIHRYTLLFYL